MREEGIDFQQCTNAFLRCSNPARLQELADSLMARDLLPCGRKWQAAFTPFFTERERKQAGCQHRLFFAQAEQCDKPNLPPPCRTRSDGRKATGRESDHRPAR